MPSSKIIFLLLAAVIVDIDNVLCHPKPSPAGTKRRSRPISAITRPAFVLTGSFDTGPNSMKNQIEANSPPTTTLHLAHVFPWKSIQACVIQYWNNNQFAELDRFVKDIFTVDKSAQAPTRWSTATKPDSTSFITHENYLRRMPASPSGRFSFRHSAIRLSPGLRHTATMLDQNTYMKNEARNALNNRDSNTLLKYLQSAPANLRYGEETANRIVNDRFDPMGRPPGRGPAYEILSRKEGKLVIWYNACGKTKKDHYKTSNNYLHIPSSSSRHGEIRQPL